MRENYRSWVELNEQALCKNVETLRSLTRDGTRFCAVVKGNAYGHGLSQVLPILLRKEVDAFAVDRIEDALEIRNMAPSALILIMGFVPLSRLQECIDQNLQLIVYDTEVLTELERLASACARVVSVHIKLETGTARQGVLDENLETVLATLRVCSHIKLAGVSTHFANIEEDEQALYPTEQFTRFQSGIQQILDAGFEPTWIHCACSAAIFLYPETHGTLVRAGVSLYGLWPSEMVETRMRRHQERRIELLPVLSWKSRIVQVKTLPGGSPIGYGLTERLTKRSHVAVVPTGYWDGYDRGLSSVGEVLVGGRRCKILGRVFMNMIVIDVSDVPDVHRDQVVTLLGRDGMQEISANELAVRAKTISYEIVTRIQPALPRIVVSHG